MDMTVVETFKIDSGTQKKENEMYSSNLEISCRSDQKKDIFDHLSLFYVYFCVLRVNVGVLNDFHQY